MQAEEVENRKRLKKRAKTQLTRTEQLIGPIWRALMVSVLQSDDQRDRTSREKSENSRKVVSREMVCFKIMKLVYNNSIYTKTF